MNFKAILLAVSLIGASAGAYANPVLVGGDQNASPDIEVYNFAHEGFIGDGSFTHWLAFTVDGDRFLNATFSASTPVGAISFTNFDLYTAIDGTLLSTGNTSSPLPSLSFGYLTGNVDGPATYWLKIAGSATIPSGFNATYAGTITAAVPEPSTYGMLALGLGLIGFAARSRSKFSA
ncbi:PEP-CTERM sorting domain-containing protein [Methylobacillus flagellatus]|nr:PEP-CTERM sorting domain-containing protein [Methylobacillus flagellatus]